MARGRSEASEQLAAARLAAFEVHVCFACSVSFSLTVASFVSREVLIKAPRILTVAG